MWYDVGQPDSFRSFNGLALGSRFDSDFKDPNGYVNRVWVAPRNMEAQGCLLPMDAAEIVNSAAEMPVLFKRRRVRSQGQGLRKAQRAALSRRRVLIPGKALTKPSLIAIRHYFRQCGSPLESRCRYWHQ